MNFSIYIYIYIYMIVEFVGGEKKKQFKFSYANNFGYVWLLKVSRKEKNIKKIIFSYIVLQ